VLSEHQLAQLRRAPGDPNRLRRAMELVGLTQVQLAEAIGVTQSHVNKIVNGNYVSLPLEMAQRLSDYFGCPTDLLFPSRAA
jgi:plasmid maintenance system antidote protein VapI